MSYVEQDALALAVHVVLMSEGFVAMAAEESGNGPKGFAPPVRPVPESRLLPSGWNADPTAVTLTYRHDHLKGRDIKVRWPSRRTCRAVALSCERSSALASGDWRRESCSSTATAELMFMISTTHQQERIHPPLRRGRNRSERLGAV